MQFFIPAATTDQQRDEVYASIKKHLGENLCADFSARRIRVLQWVHAGKHHEAEVGKQTSFNGEIVVAILYEPLRDLYHVCTPDRGVLRGGSILAGAHSVRGSLDFEG